MSPAVPFFSIIITTHQRPQLLRRALQSVGRQTFRDFETLVVADALDAATAETCSQLLRPEDVFLKRNGPPGPAASRNLGLTLARGAWVMFLDDDDSFKDDHLASAHRRITGRGDREAREFREALVLFSDYDIVTENRSLEPVLPLSVTRESLRGREVMDLHIRNFIPNNALVFQRPALAGCAMDPHLESLEDWDFLLAVCAKAMPVYYEGGGAVVHKDIENPQLRRGSKPEAQDANVVLDTLAIFRRWRAPDAESRTKRQAVLRSVGLELPLALF